MSDGLSEGAGGGIVDVEGFYVREKTVDVLGDVAVERRHQDAKWGEQNHAGAVWAAILAEEVGELAEAVLEQRVAEYNSARATPSDVPWLVRMRKEAVQVAAVAVAIVEWMDRGRPLDTDIELRGQRDPLEP